MVWAWSGKRLPSYKCPLVKQDVPGTRSEQEDHKLSFIIWVEVGLSKRENVKWQFGGLELREEVETGNLCMRHTSLTFKAMGMCTMVLESNIDTCQDTGWEL